MADQLSSTASTATSTATTTATTPLSSIPILGQLSTTLQSTLDRLIPPSTRETVKQKLTTFATTHPTLASFLLSQIAISGLPLALFLIVTLTIVVFALLAGILVGLVGALLFIVFAVGFALLVLLPTLFVTTFFAVAVWLWGMAAWYVVKWFNEKSVPGIHRPLGEGLKEELGLEGLLGGTKGGILGGGGGVGGDEGNGTDQEDGAEKPVNGENDRSMPATTHENGTNEHAQRQTKTHPHPHNQHSHPHSTKKPKDPNRKKRSNSNSNSNSTGAVEGVTGNSDAITGSIL